jgi:hypothetical protein
MTSVLFIIYHTLRWLLQFQSFYIWLATNKYFLTLVQKLILLNVILFLTLFCSVFVYSHLRVIVSYGSACQWLSCYSCHMESPMTGNYRCFLACSLIVILGYVNLTYTSNKSILLCDIVRWIEETFLVLEVKVSYTNTFITCSLFSFCLHFFLVSS